jgi:tetratricopeptide (TPR) repeat protein/tRNA A-37 threonylcarbamoyl transferase component Bud32
MAITCPKCHSENPETKLFCADCGTQLPSSKDIHPEVTETLQTPIHELTMGSTLAGRYQIIEELGHGGMGRVYKVFDTKIKEKVALKLIKPEVASDKETIERFSNEIRLARRIGHRNVCKMFDIGEAEGAHFITMEYVHGEDLKSMIHMSGSLSLGMLLSVGKQVCDGLAEAHTLGVVHRDLKPQNIMIDKNGNAKIMDFGIARSVKDKGITGAGIMIGTPEYMSPEQAEAKEVDHRSDIYSLGVILYEMATSHVPFTGETALSIAMKHKGEVPKNPKQLNPLIPDDLSGVILKCLEKDKTKRYQSASDVHSELEKIEKGIPTTERVVPERKTITSREITVKFTLRKIAIPAFGFLALAAIALVVFRFIPKKQSGPSLPSGKPSLAIVYFENITGDKSLDVWKTGLTELFITKLSQSKFINVFSSDRVFSILKRLNLQEAKKYSTEDLVKVADEGGAVYTLSGSLMKAGKTIIITLTLQKPRTGEVIIPLNIECNGEEEIFPKVDELTNKIKANLNLTPQEIASDNDQEVGKITTRSPEAYKFYSEGRRYHMMMDSAQSIPLMEKAIALDPNFAMAYRSLATSYYSQGSDSEYKKYLQKAFELSSNVSERERYIIQGDYYLQSEKTYDQAIEIYTKLLELYPDDSMAHSKLADIYYRLEQWDKAIEEYEASIKIKDDSVYTYDSLASCYNNKGLFDKGIELLKSYLNNISDSQYLRFDLADAYFYQRKFDLALIEAEKAYALDPAYHYYFVAKGDIIVYQGDLIKAEQEYKKLLSLKTTRAQRWYLSRMISLNLLQGKFEKAKDLANQGIEWASKIKDKWIERSFHDWLAYISQASGNLETALSENDKVWASAVEDEEAGYQIGVLEMKGLIYLDKKELDKAQSTAGELQALIQKGIIKNEIRHYYHLVGKIELERKNYSKAIDYFQRALALMPYHWADYFLFDDSLAFAYYKTGDLEKARGEYERIISLLFGRINYPEVFAKTFYILGQIYEQQGQKAKAIANYHKFLDLWKDADPGFPEVEDARKRLAGLS